MADLVVIVPSRGRPDAALELVQAFADTCTADTTLLFAVDESDEAADEYSAATSVLRSTHPVRVNVIRCPSSTMVEALNMAAARVVDPLAFASPVAIGFMGDDHRPRTKHWDAMYLAALDQLGTGIVYGHDLLQGEKLPTQCAMTADIVRTLGHMAPPTLRHMYVDNYWLDLGRAAGCIRYLPEVVVEHMHPFAGKSEWTEGHRRVNDRSVYQADEAAYGKYLVSEFPTDVAKVRALRSAL